MLISDKVMNDCQRTNKECSRLSHSSVIVRNDEDRSYPARLVCRENLYIANKRNSTNNEKTNLFNRNPDSTSF